MTGQLPTARKPVTSSADRTQPDEIARWLASGEIGVLPTETVYGLGVKPENVDGVRRVFELKGRPNDLNLPVVIGGIGQLDELGVEFNDTARLLATRFWPGPLTLVMGFSATRPRVSWLNGRIEVAIRFPAYRLLTDVALAGGPLLLTSANGHGTGPKADAGEAVASLHGTPDFVIDAGTLSPTPSTIINTRLMPAVVERLGAIGIPELTDLLDTHRIVMGRSCNG